MPTKSPYTLYRPARQTLTKMEMMYAQQLLEYDHEPEIEREIDFIARATDNDIENPLNTRRGVSLEYVIEDGNETLNIGGVEITYSFSYARRNNMFVGRKGSKVPYGSPHWSFRHLYEYLCHVWNGGEYFIDEYLNNEFIFTDVYTRLTQLHEKVIDAMVEELYEIRKERQGAKQRVRNRYADGSVEREYFRTHKRLSGFSVWKDTMLKAELEALGEETRQQIITALSTGTMQMVKRANSVWTERRKEQLGFSNPKAVFYASGQLINNMSIYIALEKEAV